MDKASVGVHFRCPRKLLEEFDSKIEGWYSTRTAALIEAMKVVIMYRGGTEAES